MPSIDEPIAPEQINLNEIDDTPELTSTPQSPPKAPPPPPMCPYIRTSFPTSDGRRVIHQYEINALYLEWQETIDVDMLEHPEWLEINVKHIPWTVIEEVIPQQTWRRHDIERMLNTRRKCMPFEEAERWHAKRTGKV